MTSLSPFLAAEVVDVPALPGVGGESAVGEQFVELTARQRRQPSEQLLVGSCKAGAVERACLRPQERVFVASRAGGRRAPRLFSLYPVEELVCDATTFTSYCSSM